LDVITLTADQFDGLARSYGDPSAIAVLCSGQLSRRLVLIREVVRRAVEAGQQAVGLAAAALAVLAEVDARHPEALRDVLAHPHLGTWAATCLRSLSEAGDAAVGEVGQLGSFAAASAVRAGVPFSLTIPSRGGDVYLPTLGAAVEIGDGLARVHGDGDSLVIVGTTRTVAVEAPFDEEGRHWAPVRVLSVEADGLVFTVAVEDLDPYRDCYSWRPSDRLATADVDRLRRLLADAWRLLVRDHPEHAGGMRSALRSVVPLLPTNPGGQVSAASRATFGSLALSVPGDPATLAMLLIHEFQHVKLGGLLDLVDLYRRGGDARHFAPWRADPRPIGGLLQGVYAFVGVTDFWRRHRSTAIGAELRTAEFEFALRRRQTTRALEELAASGELTAVGSRFVSHLYQTLRSWRSEAVPREVEAAAHDTATVDAVYWRLTHRVPHPEDVGRLADAWHRGRRCPEPGNAVSGSTVDDRGAPRSLLARLIRSQVTGAGPPVAASRADRSYLSGDYDAARRGYLEEIQREGAPDAWAGLAVTTHRLGRPGARALATRPELAQAVVARLASYAPPDLVAEWIESAIPP